MMAVRKFNILKDPSWFIFRRYWILENYVVIDGTITLWGARRKIKQLKRRKIIQ